MSERLVAFWYCDHCDRGVKRGTMPPSGWCETSDRHGCLVHSCPDAECRGWMKTFCEQNGLKLPWRMRADAGKTEASGG